MDIHIKERPLSTQYNAELYKMKAQLCKTFSDPKRLMILNELRSGEKQVGDLARTLQTPQAVISRHLAVLRERGVVVPRREGTNVYYSLTDSKIGDACDLMHNILLSQIEKNRELAKSLIT